mmetsp:Transcript_82353/g.101027  ORF Transcript_82353/g.101027 Transcript_82353/m.101027 type:complete len:228 (-) Transcript_82353:72-755(-)
MLKSGRTTPAIPSKVRKVRIKRMIYPGITMWKLLDNFVKAPASAPNRLRPPSSSFICFSNAAANSSSGHEVYSKTRAVGSTTFMKPPFSPFAMKPTSCITLANKSHLSARRCWIPAAKPSMMWGSTVPMRPKSRKANRPSFVKIRLPAWGSAWTNPVKTKEDTQASTAMSTIFIFSSSLSISCSLRPSIHSKVNTRAVPFGPVYSGNHLGAVTKGRKRCFFKKSSAL